MLSNDDGSKFIKLAIIIVIFIFLIIAIFSMRSNKKIKYVIMPNKEKIIELFNNINENYTLEIEENINNKTNNIVYSKDKDIILFEGSGSADGYLSYNGKLYELDSKKEKITKSKLSSDFIENKYYDIDLIKKVINYCEPEYVTNVKALCKIKYSDYLNEYNNKYNENIETNYDNFIEFYIVHYSNRIGKILIDYTELDKVINDSGNEINYGIKITDIDSNDYSDYLKYFSKELNK